MRGILAADCLQDTLAGRVPRRAAQKGPNHNLLIQAKFRNALLKRAAVDAQDFRRALALAPHLIQDALDEQLLAIRQLHRRQLRWHLATFRPPPGRFTDDRRRSRRYPCQGQSQIAGFHPLAHAQDRSALHGIAQLAHVPRPTIALIASIAAGENPLIFRPMLLLHSFRHCIANGSMLSGCSRSGGVVSGNTDSR